MIRRLSYNQFTFVKKVIIFASERIIPDYYGTKTQINNTLSTYEQSYGITPKTDDNSVRLENIILTAHEQSGQRVVILVDEYDTVMLHNLGNPAKEREVRECVLGTFGLLKAMDEHLQFIFSPAYITPFFPVTC